MNANMTQGALLPGGNIAADIFARYGMKDAPEKPGTATNPLPYAALEINSAEGKQTGLRLHLADGRIHLMPYASLRQVSYAPPGLLALEYESNRVTMIGRALLAAVALLQTQELAAIYCFDGQEAALPEEGQPVVLRLEVTGNARYP
ncbi:MAG: hypothetical protein R2867_02790 [Caldilineaceae bacterium]